MNRTKLLLLLVSCFAVTGAAWAMEEETATTSTEQTEQMSTGEGEEWRESILDRATLKVFNGNVAKPVWYMWRDEGKQKKFLEWARLGTMRNPTEIEFTGRMVIAFSVKDPSIEKIQGPDGFAVKEYRFDASAAESFYIAATAVRGENPATGQAGWYVRVASPVGGTSYEDIKKAAAPLRVRKSTEEEIIASSESEAEEEIEGSEEESEERSDLRD